MPLRGELIALMFIEAGDVVVCIRNRGIDRQCVLVGLERLLNGALIFEYDTQVKRGNRTRRIDFQCFPVQLFSLPVGSPSG